MFFDTYCPVTGWASMRNEDEFIHRISVLSDGANLWDPEEVASTGSRVPSTMVQNGLHYPSEDFKAINKYVLITPYTVNEAGEMVVTRDFTAPEVIDESTFTYVFDVHPSDPAFGVYFKGQGDNRMEYRDIGRGRIVIHFCAFLILQHLIPGLKAHVFYKLVLAEGGYESGVLRHVSYGPVGQTHGQLVQWEMVASFENLANALEAIDSDDGNIEWWWLNLLTQEGMSDDEILKDAWMGRGNMWVFKHPGLFPIAEAVKLARDCPQVLFATLYADDPGRSKDLEVTPLMSLPHELMEVVFGYLSPRDMLRLISTTKTLYGRFRTHLDGFTYIWIRQHKPRYLPVGPIPCEEGDTEIVRWGDDWSKLGISARGGSGNGKEIPWFAYHLACEGSLNVRSRKRIWDIVLEIKALLTSTPLV